MEEKLLKLYQECISELESIGIELKDVGKIDISLAKKKTKRYGCCKQENPDPSSKVIEKKGYRRIIKYEKYNVHHIEVSKWVMELDDKVIKNTIIHELIHCIPFCNNHGETFKKYARYINQKLGYDIKRVGNPKADYERSNIPYVEKQEEYKYKIVCKECGQEIYRKRFNPKLIRKYRCGKCGGRLQLSNQNVENCYKNILRGGE